MVNTTLMRKIRNRQTGAVVAYELRDQDTYKIFFITSEELKKHLIIGDMSVKELKITRDGKRIIDKHRPVVRKPEVNPYADPILSDPIFNTPVKHYDEYGHDENGYDEFGNYKGSLMSRYYHIKAAEKITKQLNEKWEKEREERRVKRNKQQG